MTLSDLSIKRPVFAWMLMSALIVFGTVSFLRLGVSQMPDVDFPVLNISVTWDGAAPEIMEAELVEQIEEKVIGVEGIKEIRSSIRQGSASVKLEFQINRDIDAALQEVQAAISRVKLPLGVDVPIISKSNPEDEPILWLGIAGDRPLVDLIRFVDLNLRDQFQIVPGVGELQLGGFTDRNLRIWLNNDKLRDLQLTVLDVVQAIEQEHTEIAAGYLENDQKQINVRTMGEGMTEEQVRNIIINRRGGEPIYDSNIRIGDVARVEDGLNDITRLASFNGKLAVALGVRKQRGSNEVKVAEAVKAQIADLQKTLPPDIKLQVNVDFTTFTKASVEHTEHELLMAALLTSVICYLFLGSFSSALNVVLAIPTSVIGTFIILYFCGFTLNLFTLLGLALAIGIIVDDAIMMLENIVRHFQMGKDRVTASIDGAREITFAAVAATIAVVAIFLPVIFMDGIIGKFFFQFGIVISAAVLLSLLEAITLTPMRCSQFLTRSAQPGRVERAGNAAFGALAKVYARLLGISLNWRWTVCILSAACFAGSLLLMKPLRKEFVPPQDQNFVRIPVQAPPGTSLAAMSKIIAPVEQYLSSHTNIVQRFFRVTGGFDGQPNQSTFAVTLVDKSQRNISQQQFIEQMRADFAAFKGAKFQFQDLSTRGLTAGRTYPVAFNIRGPDYAVLKTKAKEIMDQLQATGLAVDLDTDYREGQPELRIIPDRSAAAARGVTVDTIGRTINAAIGGIRQGKFTSGGRRYDTRLRLEPSERLTPEDVNRLQVRTSYGELLPLSSVVKLDNVTTVQSITRVNRQRTISIFGSVAPGKSQADTLAAAESISLKALPEFYSFHLEGGAQSFAESGNSLVLVFSLGLIVAYMVLASQFNSFLHPITVLLALPFSLSGAVATLWLADKSINLYSVIGIILLAGIAKKNSILLVEFTNHLREHANRPVKEALLEACPIRLRPILMTSIATISSAVPTALGVGPGSEARMPMALAIIGGVFLSTLFTLFVVPCAYSLFAPLEGKKVAVPETPSPQPPVAS